MSHPGSRSRRELVRRACAAPILLTLTQVGEARTTSWSRCLVTPQTQPAPTGKLEPTTTGDGWYRVELILYDVGLAGRHGDVTWQKGLFFVDIDNVRLWRLDSESPWSRPPTLTADFDNRTFNLVKRQSVTTPTRGALAYVRSDGSLAGYAWEPNGGTHATRTCWQSVIAGKSTA